MRIAATVLTMAALLVWARVGPGAFGAGLFILLAVLAFESRTGWARSLDASADAWVVAHRSRGLWVASADMFRALGEPVIVAPFALAAAVVLSSRARSPIRGIVLLGALTVGVAIEETLKLVLVSFPSGHVMGTATLLGLIAVFLAQGRGPAIKIGLALTAAAGVVFVGVLALVCQAHSVTDVLGGMALGAAMVSLGVAIVNAVESRRRPMRTGMADPDRSVRSRVPVA